MTTPKRNEAVAPVAWAMTDYQADGAMTILTSNREQADFWGEQGIQIDNLYPASAIAALQGEVSRLREALSEVAALDGTESNEWDGVERVMPEMARIAREALNLEPPTNGR